MPDMPGSRPSVAARHLGPALGFHQLRPAAVELTVIALAHAEIAGPGLEAFVEALMPQTHLRVHRHATRNHAAAGAGAFLPIVHVILLEGAGRTETAHPGQADRLRLGRGTRAEGGLYRRKMRPPDMVGIAAEVFGRELPIARHDPFVHTADDFDAALATIEKGIQIPGHLAEILGQWRRLGVEG